MRRTRYGMCRDVDCSKGYGFIRPSDYSQDFRSYQYPLQNVSYQVSYSAGKRKSINVTIINDDNQNNSNNIHPQNKRNNSYNTNQQNKVKPKEMDDSKTETRFKLRLLSDFILCVVAILYNNDRRITHIIDGNGRMTLDNGMIFRPNITTKC